MHTTLRCRLTLVASALALTTSCASTEDFARGLAGLAAGLDQVQAYQETLKQADDEPRQLVGQQSSLPDGGSSELAAVLASLSPPDQPGSTGMNLDDLTEHLMQEARRNQKAVEDLLGPDFWRTR